MRTTSLSFVPGASNSSPPTRISDMNRNHSSSIPFVTYTTGLSAKQYIIKHVEIMYYVKQDKNCLRMNINTDEA